MKRKLRRKKQNQIFSAETTQHQVTELVVPQQTSVPKRKKIAKVIPNYMLTTTTTPSPQTIVQDENANNRTEEESRCK